MINFQKLQLSREIFLKNLDFERSEGWQRTLKGNQNHIGVRRKSAQQRWRM
jgi:hypothetical protein